MKPYVLARDGLVSNRESGIGIGEVSPCHGEPGWDAFVYTGWSGLLSVASYVPTRAQAAELVWNRATEGATP